MKGHIRLAARFAALFAVALALLAALWIVAAPSYSAAVSAAAEPLFRLVERPQVSVLRAEAGELWVYRSVGEGRVAPFMFFDRYAFFAVVPLLALFAATPSLRRGRRLALALSGVAALFLLHVAYVVASVELSYSAAGLAAGGTREAAQWATRLLWEAAPILIWVFLTFGAWRRAFAALRATASPVGSARQAAGMEENNVWTRREGRTV